MENKITDKLAAELKEEKNIQSFLDKNTPNLVELNLSIFLKKLLKEKHLKKSDIIRSAGLTDYGYKIFSGDKQNPSRDKVIAIALSMKLTVDETNHLLIHAHHNILYARNRWDAIIIYSLQQKFTVIQTNELLSSLNVKPFLGTME